MHAVPVAVDFLASRPCRTALQNSNNPSAICQITRKHTAVACTACKPVTTLPNGLQVCYASKYDVSFLYREIFQEQVYLQHGVQLAQGDVVVDVGGNIGFFALFAAQQVGPRGKVVILEPIPPLHKKLVFNVKSHRAWCQSQGDCKQQGSICLTIKQVTNN